MTKHVSVLVVGGGISGLVCGYALRRSGIDALVVEAGEQPGGMIRTERQQGYLVELGPQSFSGTEAIRELCSEVGIADQLLEAPARAPRYLLVNGQLRQMPLSPPAFFASSLFSAKTKWSLLRDVFGRSKPAEPDETLGAFTRRKFTPELLEKLLGPFVSGIYAGDPEKLSVRAAFPQVYEAEWATGSVVRGMIRAGKRKAKAANGSAQPRRRPTLQTFREGNGTLIQALAARLGTALQTGTCATEIRREVAGDGEPPGCLVTVRTGNSTEQIRAENLVLATATDVAAQLIREISGEVSAILKHVVYAPIAVVSLGYAQSAVGRVLDGFGFLIPRPAGLRILGTVWNSSLFAGRAPAGHVLLTSFVGGATDPAAVSLAESELSQRVHRELTPVLQLRDAPTFAQVTKYERALPQYNLGHAQLMAKAQASLALTPGVFLAGNYLRGPAFGACVEQALAVAKQVKARMEEARAAS
jgi:oxygen-dependent protoporphyrinogen oxidase